MTAGWYSMDPSRIGDGATEALRRRIDAINHREEIRAAYWSGRTISDLADQWGVSLKTITVWVYND